MSDAETISNEELNERIKKLRETGAYSDDDIKNIAAVLDPNQHRFSGLRISPLLRAIFLKEFVGINISETWIKSGTAWYPWDGTVRISGEAPDSRAKLPDNSYRVRLVCPLTEFAATDTYYPLPLTQGDNWTLMEVEVLRSMVETPTQVVTVKRGGEVIGQGLSMVMLTGAEKGNAHTNIVPQIAANYTDTVVIYTTYWYSPRK